MPKSPTPTDLQIAFAGFQGCIADLKLPAEPDPAADADSIEAWRAHLAEVSGAFLTYFRAVVANLGDAVPAGIVDRTPSIAAAIEAGDPDFACDAVADVTGAIGKAANRIREAA